MQVLMDAGLGLGFVVERMGSLLGITILYGRLDLIRFLFTRGANPNDQYKFSPVSLLYQAALLQSTDIMRLLVSHGATIQASKALQGAVESGSIEAAALLLELGADINEVFRWDLYGEDAGIIGSVLHIAVWHDQEAMVEFLLRRGATQDLLDGDQVTVRELAETRANPVVVVRLLDQYNPLHR